MNKKIVLTAPGFEHVANEDVHKASLRFWYVTRPAVKHWHDEWQTMSLFIIRLKQPSKLLSILHFHIIKLDNTLTAKLLFENWF